MSDYETSVLTDLRAGLLTPTTWLDPDGGDPSGESWRPRSDSALFRAIYLQDHAVHIEFTLPSSPVVVYGLRYDLQEAWPQDVVRSPESDAMYIGVWVQETVDTDPRLGSSCPLPTDVVWLNQAPMSD